MADIRVIVYPESVHNVSFGLLYRRPNLDPPPAPPPPPVEGGVFVVVYPEEGYNVSAARRLFYSGAGDTAQGQAAITGAEPVLSIGGSGDVLSIGGTGVLSVGGVGAFAEQPPAFIARGYHASRLLALPAYRQNAATDYVLGPNLPETNTNFIARYRPPKIARLPAWWQNPALDFIQSQNLPETQLYQIGRYRAAVLRGLSAYRQNAAVDYVAAANLPETAQHFIARYHPARLADLRRILYLGERHELPPPPAAPPVETYFIAPYRLARWNALRLLVGLGIAENIAADYSSAQATAATVFSPPTLPPVPISRPSASWPVWLTQIARTLNFVVQGKINATSTVTLNPNATSTLLYDSRVGLGSHVTLSPRSASAAAALAAGSLYFAQSPGLLTIHHAASTAGDQTFSVLIIG